ncbi:MAG TPA: hypothetical protein VGA75_06895 [Paracoccaceae bacterium]
MEMLPPAPPPAPAYARFAAATGQQFPTYRNIMRGRVPALEINAAERFTRRWIAANVNRPDAPWSARQAEVVDGARADPALNGFGLVVAAMLALRLGRFAEAGELAERAYATDQHETFAQRVFLAAAEQSQSLRLEVDDWLEDRFCPNPFTDVEVIGSGDVYTCCAAWLPASIGSARDPARPDYWHGTRAAELRRSVLDGDFGYCSRLSCPRIAGRNLPRKAEVTDPALRAAIDSNGTAPLPPPRRVLLSYDTSCNLSCPSCRSRLITSGQREVQGLDAFYDDRIAPLLADATHIKITGSGDPFGSRHFRHVLAKLTAAPAPEPRLQLHTNGVLFDERAWQSLKLEGHVRSVWISVDATDTGTYAELRRGGSFARLLRNLEFLGRLRAGGRIGQLRLDFVVQAANFRQMPDFVDLARRIGADGVHFLMLRNWGTFTPEDYRARAVAFETHPEFPELLRILADDRFGAPGVDLGNLAPLRLLALAKAAPLPAPALHASAAEPARAIAFVGVPRTGTNYLFQCLSALDGLMVLNEVFNPRAAYGFDDYGAVMREHFSTLLQTDFHSEADQALVRHIAGHPADALAQIRAVAGRHGFSAVAFKIFPRQLPPEILGRGILGDPAVIPIFVARQMLGSYISYRKAQRTEIWRLKDTTSQKITLDPEDYRRWHHTTLDWYATAQRAIRAAGLRCDRLLYEDFTACPPVAVAARVAAMLRPFGLTLALSGSPEPTLVRQDRSEDPFDRIANGAAFRHALARAGLLQASLAPPPFPA